MRTRSKAVLLVLTLMVCMGVFFCPEKAHASGTGVAGAENLTVDRVWMDAEILNIAVTDKRTGVSQTLGVSLREYAGNSEYVSVQAVDMEGNKSNTIQIKNPFYVPEASPEPAAPATVIITTGPDSAEDESNTSTAAPFTPDGTGTIVDNVREGNSKEFFSIESNDGNVFYLIVDRQRTSENVYLLNPVTEQDLASLADPKGISAIPEQPTPDPTAQPTVEPTAEPLIEEPSGGINGGSTLLIIVAVLAAGGAGYYFKIIKPKKDGSMDDGEDDYDPEEDEGMDYEDYGDEPEGGGRA